MRTNFKLKPGVTLKEEPEIKPIIKKKYPEQMTRMAKAMEKGGNA